MMPDTHGDRAADEKLQVVLRSPWREPKKCGWSHDDGEWFPSGRGVRVCERLGV